MTTLTFYIHVRQWSFSVNLLWLKTFFAVFGWMNFQRCTQLETIEWTIQDWVNSSLLPPNWSLNITDYNIWSFHRSIKCFFHNANLYEFVTWVYLDRGCGVYWDYRHCVHEKVSSSFYSQMPLFTQIFCVLFSFWIKISGIFLFFGYWSPSLVQINN